MEHSYEDDFVETFPQHQQPLGARHVTLLESRDNATKYTILLAIICILVVQFGGNWHEFSYSNVSDVCRGKGVNKDVDTGVFLCESVEQECGHTWCFP